MNDLFLLPEGEDKWKMLEELYSLPVEKRMEWLKNNLKSKKVEYIGHTEKSAPELAISFLVKGIKAKSYGKGTPNAKSNNNV